MRPTEKGVSRESEYYVYTPSKMGMRTFLYPLQCGLFFYEPGYRLKRHAFDSFLLMYIRRGSVTVEAGGKKQKVGENTFVLLDCYAPHGYASDEGYECEWLHFDGVMARNFYDLIVQRLGIAFQMDDPLPVLRNMQAIMAVFSGNREVKEPLMAKYINDILTEFMLFVPSGGRDHAGIVERAITYINEHFAREITIEQLCARSGLSACYFIRVFRQVTGYAPHEYMVRQRMSHARYLLEYTQLTVKEICFSTGYRSESVFCNAFRKQVGMTPQQYRKRGQNGDSLTGPGMGGKYGKEAQTEGKERI